MLNDKEVIGLFVNYLRENGNPNLKVDCIPDDHNSTSPDIDAIAGSFAIEHTSIDTIKKQRQKNDWFLKVVGGIEEELNEKLSFRLNINIEFNSIKKGQDWTGIRKALISWIEKKAILLKDGKCELNNIQGIPFKLNINKNSYRRPILIFSRIDPNDNTLIGRLQKLLLRKIEKLKPYKKKRYITVLLIESNDNALMNEQVLLEAIGGAFNNEILESLDQVWYADTSIQSDVLFFDFTEDLKQL